MEKILISINPEHVEKILAGTKKYEYRRRVAKDVSSLVIYETAPIKKVVAEVEVLETLALSPEQLWNKTKNESGTSKEFFDKYFENKEAAYAYKLGKIREYSEPKELSEFGVKVAPQSYVILEK